jgi:Short C-terminal domain
MGLLKTGLKAAVAVKTADVIHERVLARQHEHAVAHGYPASAAAVPQPPLAAPTAAPPVPVAPTAAAPLPVAPTAAPPPPGSVVPSPGMDDKLAQLRQLGELRESGVLTDAEFETQKAQILSA